MSFYTYLFNYLKAPTFVVVLLILLFAISCFFIFYKFFYFYSATTNTNDFLFGIFNNLKRQNIFECVNLCDELDKSPISNMTKAAIFNASANFQNIHFVIDEIAIREQEKLEKGMTFISTSIYLSPLLGLIGTFISIMEAFFSIDANKSIITLASLSNYIAYALISSILALIIASILLVCYNFLITKMKKLLDEMSIARNSISDFFSNNTVSVNKVKEFLDGYEKV